MPNNLYQQLNNFSQPNGSLQQVANNFGGFQNMLNEFNNFRNSMQGNNPQQIIQQLLQSGRMSQNDYNSLSQMALQFKNLFRF